MKLRANNNNGIIAKSHLGIVTIDRRKLDSLTEISGALMNIYKKSDHDFLMIKAREVQKFAYEKEI